MAEQKLYPFNAEKHAHDIEFFRNRIWLEAREMESGERPYDARRYEEIEAQIEQVEELLTVLLWRRRGPIARLTGPEIGLAKKIVVWASEERAATCIRQGRYDLLKYC